MHTQEIICPACGKVTAVNVIDTAGTTKTPCKSCKETIKVTTDSGGRVTSLEEEEPSGCIIATAAANSARSPSHHAALERVRAFRDTHVQHMRGGAALLEAYYRDAPIILDRIHEAPDGVEVWNHLRARLLEAGDYISRGDAKAALQVYYTEMETLRARFGQVSPPSSEN